MEDDHQLLRTTFRVQKMDCAAEEQLVRLRLSEEPNVKRLAFDLTQRTVIVTHSGDSAPLAHLLNTLDLDTTVVGQHEVGALDLEAGDLEGGETQQRKLLVIVLLINFGLFVLELTSGFWAQSMGLVADSLDMLADALVYALSLYAVGKAAAQKMQVAKISGYFQLALAVSGLIEVVRRFLGYGDEPSFGLMISISLIALAGNAASLLLLQRANSQEVHMKASWIFTSNDVMVNAGVILAGLLVFATGSGLPDLIVGAAIFLLVASGAFRILRLAA